MRVRYKIAVAISSSSAEEKDLANPAWEVVVDSSGEGGSWKTTIPVSTTDMQIVLPNMASAKLLALRAKTLDPTLSPVPLLIRRNLISAEQIALTPMGTAAESHFFLTTSGLTSLFVTNSDPAVAMELTYLAAGD